MRKVHDGGMTPLREARQRRGLTVAEVAKSVGTDPSNLSRLEHGHHVPPRSLARALYRFYEGDVDYIDLCDPTFRDEVGVITDCGNSWYQIKTRTKTHKAHGRKQLAEILFNISVSD